MPREYPQRLGCPSCGEAMPRHCTANPKCGWFLCLAESRMYVMGERNKVTRKWQVQRWMPWTHLR